MMCSTESGDFFSNFEFLENLRPPEVEILFFLLFQLLKRPAATVFELGGSYWYQKKRNDVLYKSDGFFFNV